MNEMFSSHIFSYLLHNAMFLYNAYKMLMHINLNNKIIFSTDRFTYL